jgi:hypothetical protein
MTNADTPVLATKGLIKDPVNPFTGKPLDSGAKNGPQTVLFTKAWGPDDLEENRIPAGSNYVLSGKDPHVASNWKYIGEK